MQHWTTIFKLTKSMKDTHYQPGQDVYVVTGGTDITAAKITTVRILKDKVMYFYNDEPQGIESDDVFKTYREALRSIQDN